VSAGPEKMEKMIGSLRKWQGIERQAMTQTTEIIEKTSNPFIRTRRCTASCSTTC
jgi:hypothetical protein